MNLPEPFPDRQSVIEFKSFSFGDFFESSTKIEDSANSLLRGSELFSLFTADIIKEDVIFTR